MGTVNSPTIQVLAAGVTAVAMPSLPLWLAVCAAAVPTVYYLLLTIDYIRNWKPPTVQRQTVGAVLAKITDLIGHDRPYLVAIAIAGVAAANYFGYPIPNWIVMLLGAGGLISVHSMAKGPIVLNTPTIAPVIITPEGTTKP